MPYKGRAIDTLLRLKLSKRARTHARHAEPGGRYLPVRRDHRVRLGPGARDTARP